MKNVIKKTKKIEKSLGLWLYGAFFAAATLLTSSCISPRGDAIVSLQDQKLAFVKGGEVVKTYPVSTSKFGVGSRRGSYHTPLGKLKVAKKIGGGARTGTVFKNRRPTGEVLRPNAPGRDPIVTRIMWLKGAEKANKNTFSRYIYIHGTPEERNIGKAVSYGCIRMKSNDIIDLYHRLRVGSKIKVVRHSLLFYDKADDDKSATTSGAEASAASSESQAFSS